MQYDSEMTEFVFDLQLFAGEKTEEPTAKRRNDARQKGQVARSQELSGAFVLLAGFFVMRALGSTILAEIETYTVHIYANMNQTIDAETVMRLIIDGMIVLAKTAFPVMIAILVMGLAINFYQVGFMFTTEPLSFKLDKLNPITGFGRIFSKRSVVELMKSLLKIAIIGAFLYVYLSGEIMHMPEFIYLDLKSSMARMGDIIFSLVFQIIIVYFIMAAADFAYQKWQTTQDLKMSKQDIKEEFKQTEGDPQIKGKIRQKQQQMAEVVAKGQDLVAQKIKDIAREHRVTIVENKPLARALYAAVEVGGIVPPELYQAVAEVLAYVYRLKKKKFA